ncbi:MAG TPA: MarR family transcriptional regulator [Pseudonocardiaceae bacterium]|jgi:DNA-binding MarR family transcriptional regulator|nr:MarR family transcriptional regulator [Pseudonocardiaceae bacterium]
MTADMVDDRAILAGQVSDDDVLRLVLAMHRLVRSLRRSAGMPGLHPTQLLVLVQLLESGPMRVGELATRVPCSQPTVTTVANGLEADGLIRRIRDTTDGRAIRLEITDDGRAAVLVVARGQADMLRQRLAELDDADRETVLAAAPVLRRIASSDGVPVGNRGQHVAG